MKTNRQKSNWILDVLLFTGFLVSFTLDLTGLALHQWIGIFCVLLSAYHLIIHWDWVTAVTLRFFKNTSGQARTYYLLDTAIMLGFYLIVMTGIVISTWLNLALTNYAVWVDFHVTTSIVTLLMVVLKVGLHWRWIVRVARQSIFRPDPQPVPVLKPVPVPVTASGAINRRDFMKLMGIVGVASLTAFAFTLNDNLGAQATSPTASEDAVVNQEAVPSTSAASTDSATVTEATPTVTNEAVTVSQPTSTTTTTTSCTVQCNKGCSFPGHCRRYQDSNGNNRCDFGECL
jgi:hypothetical protein